MLKRRSTIPQPLPEHGNAARIRRRRAKSAAMGLMRLEVLAPERDKPLLKAAAERLAGGDEAFRATLAALVGTAEPGTARTAASSGAGREGGQGERRRDQGAPSPRSGPVDRSPPPPAAGRDARRGSPDRARGPGPAAGLPPTDAQLDRARSIAERRGLSVPAGLDRAQMSDWISRNR